MGIATVTVLFTDLVGSTDLLTQVGQDRGERLRREHFELLREVVRLHHGREVKNLGDGLMVVFASAFDAVECAVGMQQRVDARNRHIDTHLLRVRVGVATGDAELHEDDYFGVPIVQAARLCASADGDEIRLTELVSLLVDRRGNYVFEDLGPIEFKGFDEPVAVRRVRWRPLPAAPWQTPLPPRLVDRPQAFVGRIHERARLEAAWESAAVGRCRLMLLSGEPGMGKTALATITAQAAHEQGAIVLYGRSDNDLGLPYQPWIEIVSHLLEHLPEALLARLRPDASLLAHLAPRLPERLGHQVSGTYESDRHYQLYRAVAHALSVASEDTPLVVVLDDLHWSDRPTLLLLRYLLSSSDPIRCLFIGTVRDTELAAESALAELLVASHRDDQLDRLPLPGLTLEEIVQLMQERAGQELPQVGLDLARLLQEETDGSPFFVRAMLRHLYEDGRILRDPDGNWTATTEALERGLPDSVLDVIGHRVDRLGDEPRRALIHGSVIGREFDLSLVARTMEAQEDEVLGALEQAMQAALITEVRPGRFSFVHALVGHALYQTLGSTRRARLHRSVATSMEDVYSDDLAGRVAELASHWSHANSDRDQEKAIEYGRRAGERALEQLAPDEALRWFRTGLDAAQNCPVSPRVRCSLLVGLGEAQRQVGDQDHRPTLLEAANTAEKIGADDLLVRAALANNRGWHSRTGAADGERIDVLEAAIAVAARPAERARLLGLLAVELTSAGDEVAERRLALADEAVETARATGDDTTLAWVLDTAIFATWVPERLAARTAWSKELVGLARKGNDPVLEYWAAARRTTTALEGGDRDVFDDYRERQLDLARSLDLPGVTWQAACAEVARAFLDGDLDEADRLATAALELGLNSGQPDALSYYGAQLVTIRAPQGRLTELEDLVRQQAEANPGIPAFRAALARVCTDAGRTDDAVAVLSDDIADGFTSYPHDSMRLVSLMGCAGCVATAQHQPAAATLYDLLLPWADRFVHLDVLSRGPVGFALGQLATALGRHDDAERHFGVACEIATRVRAPLLVSAAQVEWAACLIERGPDDLARARGMIEAALKTATPRGATGIVNRGKVLLQQPA